MKMKFKPARKAAAMAAAAAVLASGGAMAQSSVTLYGQVDSFVGSVKASGAERAYVVGAGGMQTSYWGIKGTEELGNGVKAIFDLNGFYRVDNGRSGRFDADGMFTRSAYVGLQSNDAGTLRLGRNTTPYFLSTILFNPLVDSYVFSPAVFHTYLTANNGRVTTRASSATPAGAIRSSIRRRSSAASPPTSSMRSASSPATTARTSGAAT
ncbi:hypothetical protein CURE108131_13930 [Cupriavidus respiraculi]|uniref:Porin domain-containing protein n=1 Tax=Cupriavidus respiraculi TaxID=195930 RepID=A0ABN7Z0K1_9BURK|nr:hypothetical protein LMG21510_03779 [Cupriavidus respiraculi]